MRFLALIRRKFTAWLFLGKRIGDPDLSSGSIADLDVADEIESRFPIEFQVEGVPLSLQASPASRDAWKQEVRVVIDQTIDPSGWATESPVLVTIFYFPDGPMTGDIDNIVKPILDALMPRIYVDDSQVQRVLVQKFESERSFQFENPTAKLAEAIDTERPVVYIRVDNETSSER
jgi:crossover junction endodeoxyribonuclease RusA